MPRPMPDKKQILRAIVSLAKTLGHTPSILEFAHHARISRYALFQFFPKWNKAIRAAGLKPHRLYVRPEDNELLKDWGEVLRKKRAIPSPWTYRLAGKYYPLTLAKRFGGWDSVPEAFRNFAKGKKEWDDVVALLPAPAPRVSLPKAGLQHRNNNSASAIPPGKAAHAPLKDRITYGDPLDFPGMRHEPVNEQGVVLLFGMLAQGLGYVVENVQKGFPDCEAKRHVGQEGWQRVNIEFEYESKNFRDHGHSVAGCDVIVCWRHNWPACPKHIEVLELSRVINSLATSQD